jgi:RNA recognition motif-containing protein
MEVFVKNVPPQATENGFKKFMKTHFEKLSIRAVNCQKPRDRHFASLTFLYLADAERFLNQHGQAKLPPGELIEYQNMELNLLLQMSVII